ncbi:MAG: hypothetical protein IPK13_19295 [Deltaproteobacteria bacterium]|nr:hypothetical protein [Deltaproteobacteria bacterium]
MSTNTSGDVTLLDHEIEQLLDAGARAPSGGNIQPWRVRASPSSLEISLDPIRSDSFIDVGRYASVLAIGAFAENVSICAHSLGLEFDQTTRNVDSIDKICVRFDWTRRIERQEPHPLMASIKRRATNRHPHNGEDIPSSIIQDMRSSLADLGPSFQLFTVSADPDRNKIAKILARSDRIRLFHRRLHDQMFDEIRWSAESARDPGDGVDVRSLELPSPAVFMLKLMRSFTFVQTAVPRFMAEQMSLRPIAQSGHVCALTMPNPPTRSAMVDAGRAMQRVWLTAEKDGLGVQPWTVFPYLLLRADAFKGEGLSDEERREILSLGAEMRHLYQISEALFPCFIFRLSKAKAPSVESFRIPSKQFSTRVEL